MGYTVSTGSQANPSSTSSPSSRTMSPSNSNPNSNSNSNSNSTQNHQPKPESEPEAPIRESADPPKPDEDAPPEIVPEDSTEEGSGDGDGEGEEEEEGECGFCLFMKAGGCRETFTDWEKCVEEGEKNKEDIVEKCFQATSALRKCMEAHPDYYAPLLEAEEAAVKQLEAEKEKENERSADQAAEEKLDDSEKKAAS